MVLSALKPNLEARDVGGYLLKEASFLARMIYKKVLRRSDLINVPLAICTSYLGFPFDGCGWHYLIETLREYDANPELRPEDSTLWRYHRCYQPPGTFDLVYEHGDKIRFRPPFGVFPWGNFRLEAGLKGAKEKNQLNSRFCGPSPDELIRDDFRSTIALYKAFQREGYNPWRKGFIGGTFLRKRNGELRYVVLQGNHRMAILSHLGYTSVLTFPIKGYYRVIDEQEVSNWLYVITGQCSVDNALAYFNAYFELTGFERAERYGLLVSDARSWRSQ